MRISRVTKVPLVVINGTASLAVIGSIIWILVLVSGHCENHCDRAATCVRSSPASF